MIFSYYISSNSLIVALSNCFADLMAALYLHYRMADTLGLIHGDLYYRPTQRAAGGQSWRS